VSGKKPEYKQIVFSPTAKKQFLNLDKSVQIRIKTGIQKLAIVPPQGDISKLKGRNNQYRLRVGDWRIIFRLKGVVEIAAILPRGQAYK
jgi:mRNA interferase RelE/StbE